MPRPKVINPTGDTRRIAADVPAPTADRLVKIAKRRGVPVAQVIREALENVA
jgi:hypothetical protein